MGCDLNFDRRHLSNIVCSISSHRIASSYRIVEIGDQSQGKTCLQLVIVMFDDSLRIACFDGLPSCPSPYFNRSYHFQTRILVPSTLPPPSVCHPKNFVNLISKFRFCQFDYIRPDRLLVFKQSCCFKTKPDPIEPHPTYMIHSFNRSNFIKKYLISNQQSMAQSNLIN